MRASCSPILLSLFCASLLVVDSAHAFCGFYVAKADTKLFNKSSKVVLVRDGDKTVLTMANDFQGSVKEFAIVIPVPTKIEKEQIAISDNAAIDHLDAYTAPRLVEYHDDDPCDMRRYAPTMKSSADGAMPKRSRGGAKDLGVTVEAEYTVGEYDILILSAKESDGLETWLKQNGYKIPDGASSVLGSYIKQNMKFFVAKVNLAEHDKLGGGFLRPIQVSYTSPKFMLPIRLGTVNANGTQDLFIFALTRTGRIETTNYRTERLPSDLDIPPWTKAVFADFYKDMFARQVEKHDMRAVFLEYAWDMGWCDPCAADPLTNDELTKLGVTWGNAGLDPYSRQAGGQNAYVTRLHVRYDGAHFPEDLVFQETKDRNNFQGRYVMRHPWTGSAQCEEATRYRAALVDRTKAEEERLAELTGWSMSDIAAKRVSANPTQAAPSSSTGDVLTMPPPVAPPTPAQDQAPPEEKSWWQRLWE